MSDTPMTPDRLADLKAGSSSDAVLELVAEVERLRAETEGTDPWQQLDAARAEVRALRERIAGLAERAHDTVISYGPWVLLSDALALLDHAPPVAEESARLCRCGHKRKRHQWVMDRRDICSEKGCDCSRYAPPVAEERGQ